MTDYSSWKETRARVTVLQLDRNNPRIPESGATLSQRDLIADLVENDKVHDLAKSIADNGYYPIEALICVAEDNKCIVVEGNRRLAALKALLNPNVVPDRWARRFRTLAGRVNAKSLERVRVIRAPTREAAAPVVMSKHTRGQIEGWNPLMKAKFYHNLVKRGVEVDDICSEYGIQRSEVTAALQMHTMYAIACTLDLPEEVAVKVQNPREFPITTLERLYQNPEVGRFLGIEFNADRQLRGRIQVGEFRKGYGKMVADIATGAVHSRTLNKTKEMEEYLVSFGPLRPNVRRSGNFDATTLLRSAAAKFGGRRGSAAPKAGKKRASSRTLIPKTMRCTADNQRINDVLEELKRLPVASYPNAVALMFRSLVELSLGHYLDRAGHLATMKTSASERATAKGNRLPHMWQPSLKEMLLYTTNDTSGVIDNGSLQRALRKLVIDDSEIISLSSLNLFVHNQHFGPSELELRKYWTRLEGLLAITLIEPQTKSGTE